MSELTFCLSHKEARAVSLCAITVLMLPVGPGEPAAEGMGLQAATHCCWSRAQAGLYGLVTPGWMHAVPFPFPTQKSKLLCHRASSSAQQKHLHAAGGETGGTARDLLWSLYFH